MGRTKIVAAQLMMAKAKVQHDMQGYDVCYLDLRHRVLYFNEGTSPRGRHGRLFTLNHF